MISLTVQIDFSKFRGIVEKWDDGMRRVSGPMADAAALAAARYMSFVRQRFIQQSKGGGDWPDLADSTKLARARRTKYGRRKFRQKRIDMIAANWQNRFASYAEANAATVSSMHFDILRDRGLLLNSLSQGQPGNRQSTVEYGIAVGTAMSYAKYHQEGGPHLPKREIIVQPDAATATAIARYFGVAAVKLFGQT